MPEIINIDKSGSNTGAIKVYNKRCYQSIEIRQYKYLNNIVEQDHRHVKWKFQRGLGFKEFESAKRTIGGIEVVQMIKNNQVKNPMSTNYCTFCSLVG